MKRLILFFTALLFVGLTHAQLPQKSTFTGAELQTIRIPAGGVSTGNLLVGGRGNIEHVEIFNRPDRQRRLEKTFFSLWVKEQDKPPRATLLEREILPPYLDVTHVYAWGLPRMSEAKLINNYPHLQWDFDDQDIPLDVSLEIVNPIIPLDFESSNYPVARFNWIIKNPASQSIDASLAFSMENPVEAEKIINEAILDEKIKGIRFSAEGKNVPVNYRGGMLMGTTASNAELQTHWYPGTWRDETHIFWDDFRDDGHVESKQEKWITTYEPTSYNESTHRMATVLVPLKLKPGEEITVPFYIAWYFPERINTSGEVFGITEAMGKVFKNSYANSFSSERDVLNQFLTIEKKLTEKASAFAEIMGNSSYPDYVIEALNTQVATFVSPLIQVTAEGEVHGYEGVLNNGWCCPGTCTHVWNYEQALASLFPSLEQKMREIEFMHNTFDDGFQAHRSVVPTGDYWFNGPPAADGQMGTIIRAYREWKLSGDNEWLRKLWPKIQKALEFAWHGSGEPALEKTGNKQAAWDPHKTGLLSGRQHNTYDIDFYGPSSMTSSLYLAALKAGHEMALAMGEKNKAEEYLDVFQRGSELMADSLWNGDYFIQIVVNDPELCVKDHLSPPDERGRRIPKYQYGNGCLADQLLGQYLAFVSGLGYIADQKKIDKALMAIYEHNFIDNLREFENVQRVYGLNDEAGMVLCTWPKGDRPVLPFVYAEEIWTGVEYQVAASLIYSGKVKEGLRVVEAVQNRYNGTKRNPFEHIESGVHYARALSAWSMLLALSGYEYDGVKKELTFAPKTNASNFRSFWSAGSAWGEISINNKEAKIDVIHGSLSLTKLSVQNPQNDSLKTWNFENEKAVTEGSSLIVSF